MRNRPRDSFLCNMRLDDPFPASLRKKLIRRYKNGGLDRFEDKVKPWMGSFPIEQIYYTDPILKDKIKWVYVGNFWWCRKRRISPRKSGYEFAKLTAYVNDKFGNKVDGLWDARRHITKPPPEIVYRNGNKGFIVSYNEFEVYIQWVDNITGLRSVAEPVKSIIGLDFEYVEDYDKYSRIFLYIGKRLNKVRDNV